MTFPTAGVAKRRRIKPLRTTLSLDPAAPDFAGEADLISVANEGAANIKPKRWTFTMHGFLQAPLRLSIGTDPVIIALENPNPQLGSQKDLHSPSNHVIGFANDDWLSVGLVPRPMGSLNLSVGNAIITGTVIVSAGTFYDVGYKKLSDMGAISQAYLTMKFSEAFGYRGGLAVTAGAFSNRYGLAGPNQQSSGYYNTYLFGRTRVVGANVTGDLDLTDHVELVLEGGFGAKLEVVPWRRDRVRPAPYLPDQGPSPQGSNFVWQLHPALFVDEWLKIAGHYMESYSPNDLLTPVSTFPPEAIPSSRMTILGGDVHLDRPRFGNAYLGYSHIDAKNIISLADGIEVLHSPNGLGLTRNYLNPRFVYNDMPMGGQAEALKPGSQGDSGKIDTLMFQYILRLASLLEWPATGRDMAIAVYGMFNHVTSASLPGGKQDKLKFGGEFQFSQWRYLSGGVRFDRVMGDGGNADLAYTAISPRLVFHSNWLSREYILLSYTRYFMGSGYKFVDENMVRYGYDNDLIVLSAQIAF